MVPPLRDSACDTSSPRNHEDLKSNPTYMGRLFINIENCLSDLGVDTNCDECIKKMEEMAVFIHESMSISARNYHSVQHVFDISKDITEPIPILAALFHDCIYYHVDGEFSLRQLEKLKGAIIPIENSPNCRLPLHAGCDDLIDMVISIFGWKDGQELTPMTGLNEFLSAVIAVRELQGLLPLHVLAQIACCIESTIPFRPTNDADGSPMDRLFAKLCLTNEKFQLGMTEEELVRAVQQAALVCNQDVENFGTEDRAWFLDNTWSLLPESNAALRSQHLYSVQEFQYAVFKMYGFFCFLKAPVVFQNFRGYPTNQELKRLRKNAARNIEVGRRYVAAKVLSLSVLAAFAELTGGDAPMSMFKGDLPSRNRVSIRLGERIPSHNHDDLANSSKCDMEVYDLLVKGRKSETSFDMRSSPLAAYFYGILGDEGVENILSSIKVYPMTSETATKLLQALPLNAMRKVAEQMAFVARSRAEHIHQLVKIITSEQERGHFFL